jgi:lysophospholipase L1-like esterase
MTASRIVPRLGLLAMAMLLGLGLCEVAARLFFDAPPDPTRQPQIGYLTDPDIRYVNVPNQRGWIDDGFVTIDSLGFRGREVALPKPPGRLRIVVVGDSVTLGWGVNDGDTFPAQLEAILRGRFPNRDLEVINLGVGGYDTRQEVTLLERNVARLDPDVVLVGFYSNDVPDTLDDKGPAPAAPPGKAAPAPVKVMHINAADTSSWASLARKSRLAFLAGRTLNRFASRGEWGLARYEMEMQLLAGTDSPALEGAWAEVDRQFDRFRRLADEFHFRAGIVVLPCRDQVVGQYPNAKYQTRIQAIADRLEFFVVDPLPALVAARSGRQALYIPYDRNHPSATGHRVIAGVIAEDLVRRGALASSVVSPGAGGAR